MMSVEEMFEMFMEEEGFEAWWACEGRWDEWAERMIAEGLDEAEVEGFFSELAWEL